MKRTEADPSDDVDLDLFTIIEKTIGGIIHAALCFFLAIGAIVFLVKFLICLW